MRKNEYGDTEMEGVGRSEREVARGLLVTRETTIEKRNLKFKKK